MVTCRAIVRDRYDHRDSARIFSLLMLVLAIAPLLAPTIGGWIAAAAGWHAVFYVFVGVGLAVSAAVGWRLDESRSEATALAARETDVLAGYALLRYTREQLIPAFGPAHRARLSRLGRLAGSAFFAYGFFGGLVVPAADWAPASLFNQNIFLARVGLPVQLFRALCAIAITITQAFISRVRPKKSPVMPSTGWISA